MNSRLLLQHCACLHTHRIVFHLDVSCIQMAQGAIVCFR